MQTQVLSSGLSLVVVVHSMLLCLSTLHYHIIRKTVIALLAISILNFPRFVHERSCSATSILLFYYWCLVH